MLSVCAMCHRTPHTHIEKYKLFNIACVFVHISHTHKFGVSISARTHIKIMCTTFMFRNMKIMRMKRAQNRLKREMEEKERERVNIKNQTTNTIYGNSLQCTHKFSVLLVVSLLALYSLYLRISQT